MNHTQLRADEIRGLAISAIGKADYNTTREDLGYIRNALRRILMLAEEIISTTDNDRVWAEVTD